MTASAPNGTCEVASTKLYLFQYWDSPVPPREVAAWMDHFGANNPEFIHAVFDEMRACEFIEQHHGPRERAAFNACAVPAMQADYFRLCALASCGGLYVDADTQSLNPIAGLVAQSPGAFLYTFLGLFANGILFFPERNDPFIRACLRLATNNIEQRRFNAVFSATGPGVFNAVRLLLDPASTDALLSAWGGERHRWHEILGITEAQLRSWRLRELLEIARESVEVTPDLEESFRRITLLDSFTQMAPWFDAPRPAYKDTPRHWLHWPGSIYR